MNSKQTEGKGIEHGIHKPSLSLSEVMNIVDQWLNSDDVYITDGPGGERLPNAWIDCVKGSLLNRLTMKRSIPSKPVGDVEEMAKRLYPDIDNDLYKPGDIDYEEMMWAVLKQRDAFKSSYAAAPQKGMKWVKASERLPERKAEYFVIIDDYKAVVIFDGVNFFSDDDIVTKSVTRWLDESPSPSEAGDAVEFAEWLGKNDWKVSHYMNTGDSVWLHKSAGSIPFNELKNEHFKTTAELYHQFKKQ